MHIFNRKNLLSGVKPIVLMLKNVFCDPIFYSAFSNEENIERIVSFQHFPLRVLVTFETARQLVN